MNKLSPKENPPAACEYWLCKLAQAPQYFSSWKGSASRTTAAHVLTLARTYHLDIDIKRIALGREAKRKDGTEVSLIEFLTSGGVCVAMPPSS